MPKLQANAGPNSKTLALDAEFASSEVGRELARRLGATPGSRARLAAFGEDIGEFQRGRPGAVITPKDQGELRAVLEVASAEPPLPVYTISRGRNWGLGSRKAVDDDAVILDLSRLREIRELDLSRGVAVVESGVSQGELSRALAGTPWMLNITGSSSDSSVVGNLLERGVGFVRARAEDLRALEVMLADGSIVRTGSWSDGRDDMHRFHRRVGVGPGLAELFVQSNLGVVTAAAIGLVPRPEVLMVLHGRVPASRFGEAVAAVRRLVRDGAINCVAKFLNTQMRASYGFGQPGGEYVLFAAYRGTATMAAAAAAEVRGALAGVVEALRLFRGPDEARDEMERRFSRLYLGEPQDISVYELAGARTLEIDQQGTGGWLAFVPSLVVEPEVFERAAGLCMEIGARHGVPLGITFNILDDSAAESLVAIRFDRRSAVETQRAHAALDALHSAFREGGMGCHRTDIAHQSAAALYDSARTQLLERLKRELDPLGILAPGRYGVGSTGS